MVLLCIIVLSEVCTSVVVVRLMKKGVSLANNSLMGNDVDNDYLRANREDGALSRTRSSAHKTGNDRHSSARAAQRTNTHSEEHNSGGGSPDHLNSSYSSYGSFNPNRGVS